MFASDPRLQLKAAWNLRSEITVLLAPHTTHLASRDVTPETLQNPVPPRCIRRPHQVESVHTFRQKLQHATFCCGCYSQSFKLLFMSQLVFPALNFSCSTGQNKTVTPLASVEPTFCFTLPQLLRVNMSLVTLSTDTCTVTIRRCHPKPHTTTGGLP